MEDPNCVFSNIIPYITKPYFYKFNNSAIFSSNREDEFTKMFYKLGMKSFEDFTNKLIKLQSRQVIGERNRFEKNVEKLEYMIKNGLCKIETIRGILKMISSIKGDMNDSKNYSKIIEVIEEQKIKKKVIILNELKKMYDDSKSRLDIKIQLLKCEKNDLNNLNKECTNIQESIIKNINKLKEIALNKKLFNSSEDYIEFLISEEKSERKEGWTKRIEILKNLEKQKEMLRENYNGENKNLSFMKKFIEEIENF